MGRDPQEALDHQAPHLDLAVLHTYRLDPQGPLWDLGNHWDRVGLAHETQMIVLEVRQLQGTPQYPAAQGAQAGLGDRDLRDIL